MRRLLVGLCVVCAVSLAGLREAHAWSHTGYFTRVSVLQHNFHKVTVHNNNCTVYFTVFFRAPAWKYQHRAYAMNYHRFQAKVILAGGAWVRTPVFYNNAPGNRTYTYAYDTRREGCWARQFHRVTYLQAVGCRGRGCTVPYLR